MLVRKVQENDLSQHYDFGVDILSRIDDCLSLSVMRLLFTSWVKVTTITVTFGNQNISSNDR
jgi:hypothetical protein